MADTVLIVDDDESVQTMLFKVIRSNGLQAEVASGGEEAIALASRKEYDLILLDVNMPGIDGFQVVQALRSQASVSITNPRSLLNLMSMESVMPSNHLILCHPLLLPSIFPSIRVFSNESVICIRWPKY